MDNQTPSDRILSIFLATGGFMALFLLHEGIRSRIPASARPVVSVFFTSLAFLWTFACGHLSRRNSEDE